MFTDHHVRVGDLAAGTLLVMDHDSSATLVRTTRATSGLVSTREQSI